MKQIWTYLAVKSRFESKIQRDIKTLMQAYRNISTLYCPYLKTASTLPSSLMISSSSQP